MYKTVENFIPFGFQYYREPTPKRTEWEKDLKQISEMGFNTLKYLVQWRTSHIEPDVFRFDDIEELMDLAHKYHLKVILNVIFDVAPVWFYKMHPESRMITADGHILEPIALCLRQVGGAPGPCYHHDNANMYKDQFLLETVKRLKDNPALLLWDLWNEPELTTSIKREPRYEDLVCYCENSLHQFARWLEKKYGEIAVLNDKWQRSYRDWSEVEAPRFQATFNDMVDWRLFFRDTLTDELRRRVEVVKSIDAKNPVMCHTVPFPIFNMVSCGSDDFELAKVCDVTGNSLGSSSWNSDLLVSVANGKKAINAEIHAMPGLTSLKPKKLKWKEQKKHILVPMARGITGFVFWQYRPEILGLESPAWGMTYMDGSKTEWLMDAARLNDKIQENLEVINSSSIMDDGMAILVNPACEVANFAIYKHLETYNNSIQGIHRILHDLNYKVSFIHEADVTAEKLSHVKCLWLPYPIYLNSKICKVIEEWVEAGGVLISECSFGMLEAEQGLHSMVIPGYGFDKVFGVRERWIQSVDLMDNSYHDIETGRFVDQLEMIGMEKGEAIFGSHLQEEIQVQDDVRILSKFKNDGTPAITCTTYGKGKAVWIGTLLGAAYWVKQKNETLDFIQNMLSDCEIGPSTRSEEKGVRVDALLYKKDSTNCALVFVENCTSKPIKTKIALHHGIDRIQSIWFNEIEVSIVDTKLEVAIEPDDIHVIECCLNEGT
jgi:Beta-galactosidase